MALVPPKAELNARLKKFREVLRRERLGGALITEPVNVRYLSGFTGDDSALLVTDKRRFLLTDFRYLEEAANSAKGWTVVTKAPLHSRAAGLMEKAGQLTRKVRAGSLAIEANDLSLLEANHLRKAARGVRVRPTASLVDRLRLLKSDWEVRQIEKALRIQERSFQEVCRLLKPGLREYEAAAELRYRMVRSGADDQSFECMFQWGTSSSLPHGRPTDRKLKSNSIILIDWGAKYGGYHADLTRTFFLGRIAPRLRKIHEIVAEAQRRAVARVGPGVPLKEVDAAARDYIRNAGFGKQFGHSTGHGLGLRIHESPTVSGLARGELQPGMVVTIEPGIYLPGVGGVRIEDDVLVTGKGRRVLSRLPIGLRWNGANR